MSNLTWGAVICAVVVAGYLGLFWVMFRDWRRRR